MLFFAGASLLLNSRLGAIEKKLDLFEKNMDWKFELLRSDIKEISREFNQRILALEIDKGVRQAMEKESHQRNRRPHEDQGHDLSHSNDTKST
eukprot:gene15087-10793_t